MYRLVLCDMDMTMLQPGAERISSVALEAFCSLREQGVHVGACSGRGLADLLRQFRGETWCLDTAVASNGCIVRARGKTIATHELDRAEVMHALEIVRPEPGAFLVVGGMGEEPSTAVGEALDAVREHYGAWKGFNLKGAEAIPETSLLKVNLALPRKDPARRDRIVERLRAECPHIKFCVLGYGGADMMPTGISKATGLCELMAALDISDEEVLVFGDSANDLSVMREVPGSVAVANATADVRELAHHHIGPCTEDAVAYALQELATAQREGRTPTWMGREAEQAALTRALTDEAVSSEHVHALLFTR